jgi:ABC-type transport system substrate-binding protein
MALGLLFTGCQTPTPQVIVEKETVEVVVTEIVEVPGEAEEKVVEVVVTATPEPVEEAAEPSGVGGAGEVYRMAALSDMTTLNVWAAYDPDASFWNYAVYSSFWPSAYGLTTHRWDFVPGLAKDLPPALEEEGEFWTCTIAMREDAVWSDNTPITANDWAWTANTVLALDLSGNWEAYDGNYLDRIEAVDDYTAKLYYHTKPGLARHQYGTLQGPILNKAYWEPKVADLLAQMQELGEAPEDEESDEYADYVAKREEIIQALYQLDPTGEPVGGAWMLSQWEEGAFSEVEKNQAYYNMMTEVTEYATGGYTEVQGDREFTTGDTSGEVSAEYVEGPWFDKTLFSIYSADAAVLALDAGEVDFILTPNGLSRGQVDQLSGNPNISTAQNPANGFRYMAFNFDVPPLDDVAVRQAVNCMIDKEFLTGNLMQGAAIPVYTIVPEGNGYWYNPDVTIFCQGMSAQERLEEAVRILKEAGYTWDTEPTWNEDRGGSVEWGVGLKMPDGTPFPEMTLLAPSAGYDPLRATAGVYIEQWMNQLGMVTEANLTNFNNILDVVFGGGEWDMFILGWGVSAFPDYACDFFYTGAGFNVLNYSNPDFDAMCDEFYAETDLETAREQNYAIQEVLATELPYVYLFTTPMWDAWDNTRVMFPFTDVNDGLGSGAYGLKNFVQAVQ